MEGPAGSTAGGGPGAEETRGHKFKLKIKPGAATASTASAPAARVSGGGHASQPSSQQASHAGVEVDTSLLDDSDEDGGPVGPSTGQKRLGTTGGARRAAVVIDDDDDAQPAQPGSAARPDSKPTAARVSDSTEDEPAASQPKKPRLMPTGKARPSQASAAQPTQQVARPTQSARPKPSATAAAAGGRRSGRARRPTERAFGAEEEAFDPDDLEALQDVDAEADDILDAGELDEDDDDDDMDMTCMGGAGRRRSKAGGKAGAAPTGKRAKAVQDLPETEHGDLVPAAMGQTDFAHLSLKPDHASRPLWATPDGHIFLETFSPVYKQAQDFLVAIAEPVCRPEFVHEYQLTPHSLYAAVSVGLDTETIISVLGRLSKVHLDESLKDFIIAATKNYGKVKLVLKRNHFLVETSDPTVFDVLWKDSVVAGARLGDEVLTEKALKERAVASITRVSESDLVAAPSKGAGPSTGRLPPAARGPPGSAANLLPAAAAATQGAVTAPGFFGSGQDVRGPGARAGEGVTDEEVREGGRLSIDDLEEGEDEIKVVRSFEIKGDMVEIVKKRCMPGIGSLNYPMLEEYDFRGDRTTADLNVELRPHVKLRPYQEKSLSKMFGNGRARSGIIVLPCGAGKSLVGVAAAARVRKSCLCLCTSSVSVDQWKHQFMLWTNLQDHNIARFTSDSKEQFAGTAGITITTFTMVAFSGKRSEESEKVMEAIRSREWGLLLMDEVHVVPAQMFRKVIGIIHSHCKLGLTATLVREDERIGDLNFLIGPKLYEANWLDLTRAGHIANVQCVEVWCPMTREFYREYLKPENSSRKQLLYCMNPAKFMACQFLINWHERERKDKVIVFSDNIWALREYATRMNRPFIYGPTSHAERTRVLHAFKNDPNVNTVFLSKVGDNSLDIPEANVLIQISSHAGSRRQEAQRLGRILRAKRAKSGPINTNEFNAFFYTLVSQDTQEMYYSTKRQQFLIDQGYAFKVVTNLVDTAQAAMEGQLMFSKREEQLDLLCRVLTAGLDEAGVEVGARDQDEEELAQAYGKSGVRRTAGDIRSLTGAAGLRYMEYRAEAGPASAFNPPSLPGAGGMGRGQGKVKASETAKKYQKKLGLNPQKR